MVERQPRMSRVVLAILGLDGVLSALAGALFLPLYLGPVPFPISAVLSGLVNAALVWAAGYWSAGGRLAGLPLWTWLATVVALGFGGPGGDVVFGGPGIMSMSALLLMILGALPAAVLLRRMR
jgi:hypothetical protein